MSAIPARVRAARRIQPTNQQPKYPMKLVKYALIAAATAVFAASCCPDTAPVSKPAPVVPAK